MPNEIRKDFCCLIVCGFGAGCQAGMILCDHLRDSGIDAFLTTPSGKETLRMDQEHWIHGIRMEYLHLRKQYRRVALIGLSSVLSACVTALSGPISFVGIAVPHMTKLLFGTARPVVIIPGSFLLGSVFCMGCDLIARTAFAPSELAISTVTAVFGAPVVIALMVSRQRRRENG